MIFVKFSWVFFNQLSDTEYGLLKVICILTYLFITVQTQFGWVFNDLHQLHTKMLKIRHFAVQSLNGCSKLPHVDFLEYKYGHDTSFKPIHIILLLFGETQETFQNCRPYWISYFHSGRYLKVLNMSWVHLICIYGFSKLQ